MMPNTEKTVIRPQQEVAEVRNELGPHGSKGISSQSKALEPNPTKRRRIALACTACRIRKSRCNGEQPRCASCESLGFECDYEASNSSTNIIVRKQYMTGVEDQIKALEESVKRHERLLAEHRTSQHTPNDASSEPQLEREASSSLAHMQNREGISLQGSVLPEFASEDAVTGGMAVSFVDEEDSGYFGPSSNIALLRHISRSMTLAASDTELRTPSMDVGTSLLDAGLVSVSRPMSPLRRDVAGKLQRKVAASLYELPPEDETRELIRCYFSNTGLLFPYIHPPSFFQTYEEMRSENFPKVRRTWLGLLNMVLAMATNTMLEAGGSTGDRIEASEIFYQRSLELCRRQMLRGTSLETGRVIKSLLTSLLLSSLTSTVQHLLLMSQYLQGAQKSVQTWTIHGLAVKAALSLGLHSADASKGLSPIEREMRKRTWYGCVLLDRSLSMTFGRPPSVPEDYVKIPLPEALEDEATMTEPADVHQNMSVMFFNVTIGLYAVTYRVIAKLYGQNLGFDSFPADLDMVTEIVKFERELDIWQRNLPAFLTLHTPSTILQRTEEDSRVERFKTVLTLRYMNLQVLLHRPFLVRSLDLRHTDPTESRMPGLMDQMTSSSIRNCVYFAGDIISITHQIVASHSGTQPLGAWWFSLYYVFNAALVVFASLLTSSRHRDPAVTRLDQIEKCMLILGKTVETLDRLDGDNSTVRRCAHYLAQLRTWLQNFCCSEDGTNTAGEGIQLPLSSTEGVQIARNSALGRGPTTFDNGLQPTQTNLGMPFFGGDLELSQFFNADDTDRWLQPAWNM